jgi:hypothetical protein
MHKIFPVAVQGHTFPAFHVDDLRLPGKGKIAVHA